MKYYDKNGNVIENPEAGEYCYDAMGNAVRNPVDGTIDTSAILVGGQSTKEWGIDGRISAGSIRDLYDHSRSYEQDYINETSQYYGSAVTGSFKDGFVTKRGKWTVFEFPPPRASWGANFLPPHRIWLKDHNASIALSFWIQPTEGKWETSVSWANAGIGGVITDPIQFTGGDPYSMNMKFHLMVEYPTIADVTLQPLIDTVKRTKSHLLTIIFGSTYFTDSYSMSEQDEVALGNMVQSSKELEAYNVVWEKLSFEHKQRHAKSNLPTYSVMNITFKQR